MACKRAGGGLTCCAFKFFEGLVDFDACLRCGFVCCAVLEFLLLAVLWLSGGFCVLVVEAWACGGLKFADVL